ncbi:unnamed protein product [Victoria cruziana]
MIGSFVTRGLVMLLGYTYPAYECFKAVEKNKPEIEQLRFWCQYWIIVAFLTVFERIGDAFVSWLPMYGEAKLAFFIYLWCSKTKGAVYVYETFLQPYVARHETDIDRNLLELRTRAGDMAVMYCQKAAKYGQTQVFEVLQYVASRSSGSRTNQAESQPQPQPQAQPQPQQSNPPYVRPSQVAAAARLPVSKQQQQPQREPPLRQTSSVASLRRAIAQETNQPTQQPSAQPQKEEPPSQAQPSTALQALPPPQRSSSGPALPAPQRTSSGKSISDTRETSAQLSRPPSPPSDVEITEAEATSAETVPASENGVEKAPGAEDVVMEESIRVTRARLRKTRVIK